MLLELEMDEEEDGWLAIPVPHSVQVKYWVCSPNSFSAQVKRSLLGIFGAELVGWRHVKLSCSL